MRIFGEAMKGRENLDERIASLRAQNLELRKTRAELLVSRGYPSDYSSVKYECGDCMDTGFIGTKMCHCMRNRLIAAGYESSGIGRLIETQSFDTFKLDYYRQNPEQYNYMKQDTTYAATMPRALRLRKGGISCSAARPVSARRICRPRSPRRSSSADMTSCM